MIQRLLFFSFLFFLFDLNDSGDDNDFFLTNLPYPVTSKSIFFNNLILKIK
jgi:hypothetical protein